MGKPIRFVVLAVMFVVAGAARGTIIEKADEPQVTTRVPVDPQNAKSIEEANGLIGKTMFRWIPVSCDAEPTVKVDGYAGYRIVFREDRRDYGNVGQQVAGSADMKRTPFTVRSSYCEIVLFPLANRPDDAVKDRIAWKKLEQEQYVRAVAMGTGYGYAWFGKLRLPDQNRVRKQLELAGGDDPIRIAIEGLKIKDKGSYTRNSAESMLIGYGVKAVPYLEELLRNPNEAEEYKGRALQIMGGIQGDRSTGILREFYRSKPTTGTLAVAAAYGLCRAPYRASAKAEYLDMLRRTEQDPYRQNMFVTHAGEACCEFGWREAIPILNEVYRHPIGARNSRTAFELKRRLEGRPVPKELFDAEEVVKSADSYMEERRPSEEALRKAIDAIANCPDQEAAMVVAVSMMLATTKGSFEITNASGKEILTLYPAEMVKSYLKDLYGSMTHEAYKNRIRQILEKHYGGV